MIYRRDWVIGLVEYRDAEINSTSNDQIFNFLVSFHKKKDCLIALLYNDFLSGF